MSALVRGAINHEIVLPVNIERVALGPCNNRDGVEGLGMSNRDMFAGSSDIDAGKGHVHARDVEGPSIDYGLESNSSAGVSLVAWIAATVRMETEDGGVVRAFDD